MSSSPYSEVLTARDVLLSLRGRHRDFTLSTFSIPTELSSDCLVFNIANFRSHPST